MQLVEKKWEIFTFVYISAVQNNGQVHYFFAGDKIDF